MIDKSRVVSYTSTSSDVRNYEKEEQINNLDKFFIGSGLTAGAILAVNKYSKTDDAQNRIKQIFKLNALKSQLHLGNNRWDSSKIKGSISLGELGLNAARYAEDISPFKILRTFHTSSFIQPLITGENFYANITSDMMSLDKEFYNTILTKYGKLDATQANDVIKNGMMYENGSLYRGIKDANGNIGRGELLIEHARIVSLKAKAGEEATFNNRVFEKYRNIEGLSNLGFNNSVHADINSIGVVVGKSKSDLFGKWTRAYGRIALEPGYKIMDKPLEFLSEYIDKSGATGNPLWEKIKSKMDLNLFGSDYTKSTREMLRIGGKRILGKTILGAAAYYSADQISKKLAPENSGYSQGILPGLATTAVNARLAFAERWSDNFQEYKEEQEFVAEGSTSLLTLAGLPLAGAMLGGTLGYGARAYSTAKAAMGSEDDLFNELTRQNAKSLFSPIKGIQKATFNVTSVGKMAVAGAVIGLLPALPYLPGALIGKSSNELRQEYSGEKDVAVKANRWWSSGSYEFEGTKTKYFRKGWYSNLMSNGEDISLYGSEENKDKLNPFLNPFDYLRNPYALEQSQMKDRPYPIWGMDVSYASFFGKAFEKTIGQVIKPDMVNPEIQIAKINEEKATDERLSYGSSYEGFSIDSAISDFKNKFMQSEEDRAALAKRIAEAEASNIKNTGKIADENILGVATGIDGIKENTGMMVDISKYNLSVDDGDTLILEDKSGEQDNIEIRMSGYDAPEVDTHEDDPIAFLRFKQNQKYGNESGEILKNIISQQKDLKLVISKADMSYGRYIGALIGDNNKNINLNVIKNGGGQALPWGDTDLIKESDLSDAELSAINSGKGMWSDPRYQAMKLFNELTGQNQTFNTLTRLDKLASRPELGAYITYINQLDGKNRNLSDSEIEKIKELASIYTRNSQEFRDRNKNLNRLGLAMTSDQVSSGGGGIKGDGTTAGYIGGSDENITMKQKVSSSDKGLIDAGLMLPPESPSYAPIKEGLTSAYKSGTEFSGLKGWALSLIINSTGAELDDPGLQLSRSGEQTNLARSVKDMNLGGMLGLTEAQRRFIPTSADSVYNRANPIKNNMPSWLPDHPDEFFIDFGSGNPYEKIENGELRLPGRGYESIHKELEGLNPEDYPDIFKFKILSDVALGSRQYYNYKNIMERKFASDKMDESEKQIFIETKRQTNERFVKKDFSEYRTDEDLEGFSLVSKIKSKLWEKVSHNAEQPLESLTFFRPAGKFIHNRTAIEDYQISQLGGSDIAMWTRPYSHFIKPTINKSIQLLDESFIPEEVEEKRNINQYFEALEYSKWTRLARSSMNDGDMASAQKFMNKARSTTYGAAASDMKNDIDITRAYISLDDNEKAYFANFSNNNSQEEREKIINMLPYKEGAIMSKIWARKDAISSDDPESSIRDIIDNENNQIIANNKDAYAQYEKDGANKLMSFQEYLAEQESAQYIEQTTGTPSDSFIGWDPRINLDDVKLRTLMIGKEDVREFGFWGSNEERLKQMISVNNDQEVTHMIDEIKSGLRQEVIMQNEIKKSLISKGIDTRSIRVTNNPNQETTLIMES